MKKLGDKGESPMWSGRIPRTLLAAVEARAKKEGLKVPALVRLALEDYLKKPIRPKGK
jgi:hypothetical protein